MMDVTMKKVIIFLVCLLTAVSVFALGAKCPFDGHSASRTGRSRVEGISTFYEYKCLTNSSHIFWSR